MKVKNPKKRLKRAAAFFFGLFEKKSAKITVETGVHKKRLKRGGFFLSASRRS